MHWKECMNEKNILLIPVASILLSITYIFNVSNYGKIYTLVVHLIKAHINNGCT